MHVDDFRRTLDFSELEPADESSLYYERYFGFSDVSAGAGRGAQRGPTATGPWPSSRG